MRAIRVHRFGGPDVLTLEDLPDPVPGPGQVLIDNRAAGVNPVDTYIRSGQYAALPALPYTPGWDGAGVVARTGDGGHVAVGDRVWYSGTAAGRGVGAYATRVLCRADQVHPLADRLSFAQGAAIGVPWASAHRALFRQGRLQPGERVLVRGASGAVGVAAVQLARAHACAVTGTAGSDEGLDLVRSLGAGAVRHGTPDTEAGLKSAIGGQGPDVIVEMLANLNLDQDLALVAPGGRIVVVGNRGRVEIDPRQAMRKECSVVGVFLWNAGDEELAEMYREMAPGFADGSLAPAVGLELPLAEVARAHEAVLAGGARGKVVIVVAGR